MNTNPNLWDYLIRLKNHHCLIYNRPAGPENLYIHITVSDAGELRDIHLADALSPASSIFSMSSEEREAIARVDTPGH